MLKLLLWSQSLQAAFPLNQMINYKDAHLAWQSKSSSFWEDFSEKAPAHWIHLRLLAKIYFVIYSTMGHPAASEGTQLLVTAALSAVTLMI